MENNPFCIVGMPSWTPAMPFHALAQVGGIARDANHPFTIADLNIEFYHHVDEQDRIYWDDSRINIWAGDDFCAKMWERHAAWFRERLDSIIEAQRPSLIGFSVNMSNRYLSVQASRHVKSSHPDIPVLFGGIECFPKERNTFFLENGHCDIICQGEAEISLKAFLESFAQTGSIKTDVPGFAYIDGDEIIDTGPVTLPTLRSPLPLPAFDRFDMEKYTCKGRLLPFFLSRGCIYGCNFCSESPNFHPYRVRKPEEAVREIKHTLKYAVVPEGSRPEIAFADSNVNANHRTLKRFVDLLLEENVAITWGGQAHIQPEMTREFLATMRKAGCTSIFWGIETGSQHVVDLMNKSYDAKVARRVLDDCIAVGIRSYIPIILGFPGETPEDIAETIGFIFTYQGPCTILQPGMCLVRKNAPLFERYQDFNLANNFSYDWHTQDGSNTIGVRIIRRFIVNQACCNPTLGEAEMPDTEELKNIDLNAPHHSREWYRVLRALHGQYCADIAFHQFLDGTGEERGGILRRLFGSRADREITPEKWLTRDINSDEGRARLYRTTLKALAQVKARLRTASGVH